MNYDEIAADIAKRLLEDPPDFSDDATVEFLDEQMKAAFREGGDPFFRWSVISAHFRVVINRDGSNRHHEQQASIQPYVADFIGNMAERIRDLQHQDLSPAQFNRALTEALGFKAEGFPSPSQQVEKDARAFLAARMVGEIIYAGETYDDAISYVAKKVGMGESLVKSAYSKHIPAEKRPKRHTPEIPV